MVQVRIGYRGGGENIPVRSSEGGVQIRIGCGSGDKIPVRSSGGGDPDPHRV